MFVEKSSQTSESGTRPTSVKCRVLISRLHFSQRFHIDAFTKPAKSFVPYIIYKKLSMLLALLFVKNQCQALLIIIIIIIIIIICCEILQQINANIHERDL